MKARVYCPCDVKLDTVMTTPIGMMRVPSPADRRRQRWDRARYEREGYQVIPPGAGPHPTRRRLFWTQGGAGVAWRFLCGKCGRDHQVTEERLAAKINAGYGRIVLGVDL